MKSKSKIVFVIAMFIAISLVLLIISQLSSALEPKLLWKKEIAFRSWDLCLAKESGDVIFEHGNRINEITILDKAGNTRWQLGPDLEKTFGGTSLSEDGRYFTYCSHYQMEVRLKRGYLDYIHFCEKGGKELWRKKLLGYTTISPDGRTIFAGFPGDGKGYSYFLDSYGNIFKKLEPVQEIYGAIFSPDSNYLLISNPYTCLYKKDGTLIWKKNFGNITSISDNAEYIGAEQYGKGSDIGGIYDKEGKLIYKGRARVSGNGKLAVIHYENRIELLRLPEKVVVSQFPIKRREFPFCEYSPGGFPVRISYNGEYIAILGKRVDRTTDDNLYVVDVKNNKLWEYKVGNIQRSDGYEIELSNDGKYLLFVHSKVELRKSYIYYFEVN